MYNELIWFFFCCFCTNLYFICRFCFCVVFVGSLQIIFAVSFFIPVCIDAQNEMLQKVLCSFVMSVIFFFFVFFVFEQQDDADVHVKCIAQIIMFVVAIFLPPCLAYHVQCYFCCVSFAAFSAV